MNFLVEIIKAIILGIVQGITEWLPISSTGHMLLVDEFLVLDASPQFKEMFFVVIQLASVLAVILLYFQKLNPFTQPTTKERKEVFSIWAKVLVGVIPAGVVGVLFEDIIQERFFNWQTVAIALIVYGVLFILIEYRNKNKKQNALNWHDVSYPRAFMIGLFQVLALIPGTSRSGSTIIGAISIGTARPLAAEFSFFMSIPVMLGASLLKLIGFGLAFTTSELIILLVGCVVSFLVSIWAIKFLMHYIKQNDFSAFGWYRIVVGLLVILYFGFIAA
ncbi:undecaprenyl-diphosphate phosphatase [Allofustis seminis]|uniref:undecaprenyl-diphosphate phosphatase n=1 Tax=Allofustis seminis TaxID=166939 RepID=UPI000381BF65|nr:undecaprenyl-diphosphate phosphatase [Allofustis seminis]